MKYLQLEKRSKEELIQVIQTAWAFRTEQKKPWSVISNGKRLVDMLGAKLDEVFKGASLEDRIYIPSTAALRAMKRFADLKMDEVLEKENGDKGKTMQVILHEELDAEETTDNK